jgi:hypothetical protein
MPLTPIHSVFPAADAGPSNPKKLAADAGPSTPEKLAPDAAPPTPEKLPHPSTPENPAADVGPSTPKTPSAGAGPLTPKRLAAAVARLAEFLPISSTPHSQSSDRPQDAEQPDQSALMKIMEMELDGATWESKDVMERLCPADDTVVRSVLHDLERKEVWYTNSELLKARAVKDQTGHTVAATAPAGEKGHYQPLVDIFMAVKASFIATRGNATGFHLDHVMLAYDRPTADAVGDAAPIKPDVVLATHWNKSLLWRDIMIPIEVKIDWRQMLKQIFTYARAVFVKQDRYFVLCILYNFKQKALRFCFCTRSGIVSSPMLHLAKDEGFRAFVRGLVGILSLENEAAAGIQPSQDIVNWLRTFTGASYVKTERLMIRTALRGRGTAADLYELVPDDTADAILPSEERDDPDEEYTMEQMLLPVAVSPFRRITRSATAAARLKLDQAKLSLPSTSKMTSTLPASSSKPLAPLSHDSPKVRMLNYQSCV